MKKALSFFLLAAFLLLGVPTFAADKVVVIPMASSSREDIERGFTVVKTSTGRYWMDRNLGALRPAARENDPDSWGDLYQWGRFGEGHQLRLSSTSSTLLTSPTSYSRNFIIWTANWLNHEDNSLWQGADGTNNPCPQGFKLPTKEEWQTEIDSWENTDAESAMNSPLKLSLGGMREAVGSGGGLFAPVTTGFYWSSSAETAGGHML